MVDTLLKVITPAASYDLATLEEMKVALGIADTDTSQDATIQANITQYSDIIARELNRTLAFEEMQETVRCLQPNRYYVSHWPVKEDDIDSIESPRGTVYDPNSYEVEEASGKIEFFAGQDEPIIVSYSGGYVLPDDAPPALSACLEIMIRAARAYARQQAVAGMRSLSHKEARVMFFDPNAALIKTGSPIATAAQTIEPMLRPFRRFWV
jgi:hypothetical protein